MCTTLGNRGRLLIIFVCSLGWMELHTTLAKMHYKYDLELLSRDIDWHRDCKMHLLWQKPEMRVKVKTRE